MTTKDEKKQILYMVIMICKRAKKRGKKTNSVDKNMILMKETKQINST